MNPEKKTRSDAKLKTLPEARQEEIFALFATKGVREILAELRKDGLQTSLGALSEFYSWYQLRQQFQEDQSTAAQLLEQLKASVPAMTDQELDEIGQRTFSLLAIRRQDTDSFLKVRSARFKGELEKEKLALRKQAEERMREALALEKQRFERETCEFFLRWHTDKRAREIAEADVSNEEKIKLLRQTYFADVDALQKSGTVKIPE